MPSKKKQKPNLTDSMAVASKYPEEVQKLISGVPKRICFWGDSGLYSHFKPLSKRLFGSVCAGFEMFEATIVLAAKNPASISHSSGKPIKIDIEKIIIERNLRPRRRLRLDPTTLHTDVERCHKCIVERRKSELCGPIVGRFRYLPEEMDYKLCKYHADLMLKDYPTLWRRLENGAIVS